MTGWKTKVGGIFTLLSGVFFAGAEVVPRPDWRPWFTFAGTICAAAGVGLMGIGIGHKVEKIGAK